MQPTNPQDQDNTVQPNPPQSIPQIGENLVAQAAEVERNSVPAQPAVPVNQGIGIASNQAAPLPSANIPQNSPQNLDTPQTTTDVSDKGLPGLPPVDSGNKRGKKIAVWIVALLLLGVGGYFAYTTFFAKEGTTNPIAQTIQKGTGSASDLTDTSIQTTSYLHPEGWTKVNEDGASYGLKGDSDNTWDAIVIVTEDTLDASLVNASDSVYEQLRKNPSSNVVTEGIADRFLERTGEKCTSPATLTFTPDTSVSGSIVGLFVSEATCPTANGSATLRERTVVGKDGIKRYISILAIDDEWSKNADMFQRILNSVGQAS